MLRVLGEANADAMASQVRAPHPHAWTPWYVCVTDTCVRWLGWVCGVSAWQEVFDALQLLARRDSPHRGTALSTIVQQLRALMTRVQHAKTVGSHVQRGCTRGFVRGDGGGAHCHVVVLRCGRLQRWSWTAWAGWSTVHKPWR